MVMMTNGKLKELLSTYPDESNIKIHIHGEGFYDIEKVLIEYVIDDDCRIPCIIFENEN